MDNSNILNILYRKTGEYVSGEEIAKTFNISRAAISKRIEKLRDKGVEIEAITNKGYKLLSLPYDIIQETAGIGLKENMIIGKDIHVFDEIDSTNEYIKRISKTSSEGTVAIANIQTNGKGRRGRNFVSLKGGMYFSILLKPNIDINRVPFLTQLSACSVYKALASMNINTKIKWPNDIILNNKKLAGILCEMSCEIDYLNYVISGIGINVDNVDFDEEMSKIATSLTKEGYYVNKLDLFWEILKWFDYFYSFFIKNDYKEMIEILKTNSYIIGNDIQVISGDKIKYATATDIDDNGFLVVQYDDKTIEHLNYGEISIRKK